MGREMLRMLQLQCRGLKQSNATSPIEPTICKTNVCVARFMVRWMIKVHAVPCRCDDCILFVVCRALASTCRTPSPRAHLLQAGRCHLLRHQSPPSGSLLSSLSPSRCPFRVTSSAAPYPPQPLTAAAAPALHQPSTAPHPLRGLCPCLPQGVHSQAVQTPRQQLGYHQLEPQRCRLVIKACLLVRLFQR
jgi:hypothetical protein